AGYSSRGWKRPGLRPTPVNRFHLLGDEASGLFVEHLLVATRHRGHNGVAQEQRDSRDKTEHRRRESDRDTASHQLRIAGTVDGDGGEGDDHTDNRTEKAEERRDSSEHLDDVVEAFDRRGFLEDLLVEFELERFDVAAAVV